MYERLTKRCDLGLDEFEEICFINPDDVDGMYTLDEIVDAGRYETRLAIAERLAAYEDSGLSPEDCAAYAKGEAEKRIVVFESYEHMQEIRELIQAKADGRIAPVKCPCDASEEAQELMNAKADGRLVVLPCKVGDMVYELTDCFNSRIGCKGNCGECPKRRQIIETVVRTKAHAVRIAERGLLNKTIFLSREAAEKAIAEGVGG